MIVAPVAVAWLQTEGLAHAVGREADIAPLQHDDLREIPRNLDGGLGFAVLNHKIGLPGELIQRAEN